MTFERSLGPGWSAERRLLLGLLAMVVCLYSLLAREGYCRDFRAYYVAAQAAHEGLDPYFNQVNVDEKYADGDWLQVPSRFIYPPTSLFLFAPFGKMSYRLAKVVFGTSIAMLLAGILLFLVKRYPKTTWIALGLSMSLPAAMNVDGGQVDVLILCLTLVAFFARRRWVGGLCLGVAIAIKLAPALVLLWLLMNRRWTAVLWALATSAVLTLAAVRVWGVALCGEFVTHLRGHLSANPAMLTHTFREFVVLYGRFVVMGSNTYALHYFYGTRQNPLLPLGRNVALIGLVLVVGYLALMRFSKVRQYVDEEGSFFGFLVVALFVNPLLWPSGLVACFPLMLWIVERSKRPVEYGIAMLVPFFAPVEFVANRRFSFWLVIAGWCVWEMMRRRVSSEASSEQDARVPVEQVDRVVLVRQAG